MAPVARIRFAGKRGVSAAFIRGLSQPVVSARFGEIALTFREAKIPDI
jgi:hypothetical protein